MFSQLANKVNTIIANDPERASDLEGQPFKLVRQAILQFRDASVNLFTQFKDVSTAGDQFDGDGPFSD